MTQLRFPLTDADHAQGRKDAPLTLLEYGDYECPYCGAAYPIIKRIQQEIGDNLRFVFRNFPITSAHPDALAAALAAEAAALQGRFWEMHDLLFEHQDSLDAESLMSYASSLDLDLIQFKSDIKRPDVEERVTTDQYGGMRSGVRGTPGLFINGFRYDGDWSYDVLADVLSETLTALKKVG
jgi:protein-disulfide isomerase